MVGKYKVITLCGSTRFKDEFMEAQKRLTLDGNIVISGGLILGLVVRHLLPRQSIRRSLMILTGRRHCRWWQKQKCHMGKMKTDSARKMKRFVKTGTKI